MKFIVSEAKKAGKTIGFVPTMGALHEGHASLYSKARPLCDVLVGSIYANPTQFDDKKDLKNYPRTIDSDLSLLRKEKVHLVYLADSADIYYGLDVIKVNYGTLTQTLEGAHRPGHFDGMTTIVRRLFEIVNPDMAFFGEKDFQQLAIIRNMVLSEEMNIKIHGCPIIREPDGLAMSSRNRRLSKNEHENALVLSQSLSKAKQLKESGLGPKEIEEELLFDIKARDLEPDYVKIVENKTLEKVSKFQDSLEYRVLLAAYSGKTRLIDNGAL